MSDRFIEDVHDTLWGVLIPAARIPGVENAFQTGEICDRMYGQMLEAYGRLCERLGVEEEDPDVEIIISSLLAIERETGRRMYRYGARFGMGI